MNETFENIWKLTRDFIGINNEIIEKFNRIKSACFYVFILNCLSFAS